MSTLSQNVANSRLPSSANCKQAGDFASYSHKTAATTENCILVNGDISSRQCASTDKTRLLDAMRSCMMYLLVLRSLYITLNHRRRPLTVMEERTIITSLHAIRHSMQLKADCPRQVFISRG